MPRSVPRRGRGSGGFTLLEAVVTVAVAGVVAAVAIPATSEVLDQYRLSSAASQMAMEVARARMQSIGQNRWVRLKKTSAGLIREVSSNGLTFSPDGDPVKLPKGVTFTFGESDGPQFNRQGIASSSTFVLMSNSGGYKLLSVNILGKVDEP